MSRFPCAPVSAAEAAAEAAWLPATLPASSNAAAEPARPDLDTEGGVADAAISFGFPRCTSGCSAHPMLVRAVHGPMWDHAAAAGGRCATT